METRQMQLRSSNESNDEYIIEGYATTFEPYKFFERNGEPIYEHIHSDAFKRAKMDNISLLVEHDGIPLARTENDTLKVEVRPEGLFFRADLSKTAKAREMYENVESGMINKMSWAFSTYQNGRTYNRSTKTFDVTDVKLVGDVSLVVNPANKDTSVYARSEKIIADDENKRKRLKLKLMLEEN